jgi:hypothetical protein
VLLKWSRPPGPQIKIAFPETQSITEILSASDEQIILVMGPAGPSGPAGPGLTSTFEHIVTTTGTQNYILSRPSVAGIFFLNGLMQSPAYYTLSGATLTVPSLMGVQPGDVINFTY